MHLLAYAIFTSNLCLLLNLQFYSKDSLYNLSFFTLSIASYAKLKEFLISAFLSTCTQACKLIRR